MLTYIKSLVNALTLQPANATLPVADSRVLPATWWPFALFELGSLARKATPKKQEEEPYRLTKSSNGEEYYSRTRSFEIGPGEYKTIDVLCNANSDPIAARTLQNNRTEDIDLHYYADDKMNNRCIGAYFKIVGDDCRRSLHLSGPRLELLAVNIYRDDINGEMVVQGARWSSIELYAPFMAKAGHTYVVEILGSADLDREEKHLKLRTSRIVQRPIA